MISHTYIVTSYLNGVIFQIPDLRLLYTLCFVISYTLFMRTSFLSITLKKIDRYLPIVIYSLTRFNLLFCIREYIGTYNLM